MKSAKNPIRVRNSVLFGDLATDAAEIVLM